MKTGTAGVGLAALLLVWLLSTVGVHLTSEEGAAFVGGAVTATAWTIHHGGVKGLWKAITTGKP